MNHDPDSHLIATVAKGVTITAACAGIVAFVTTHRVIALYVIGIAMMLFASIKIASYAAGQPELFVFPKGTTPMAFETLLHAFMNGLCIIIIASMFKEKKVK